MWKDVQCAERDGWSPEKGRVTMGTPVTMASVIEPTPPWV
jgi:hypothetical protein